MRLTLILVMFGLAFTLWAGDAYWALIIGWVALGIVACLPDQQLSLKSPGRSQPEAPDCEPLAAEAAPPPPASRQETTPYTLH